MLCLIYYCIHVIQKDCFVNKFVIDGSACAFDFEIKDKLIQHVQILIETCIYF
jgi:hypothetical protein